MKAKVRKILDILILVIAIILVLYFTLKDNFSSIMNQFSKTNLWFILIAILIFFISLFFKSASLKLYINEYKKSYSIMDAFKLTVIAQFLNGITPFQTGGQPFQVYLLKKDGVRITDSTNAMIEDFIAFQIALIIMGLFAVLANLKVRILASNASLNLLIFLGFLINILVLLFLMFISKTKKILVAIINFIFKLKFMSKKQDKKVKVMKSLDDFYVASTLLYENKRILIKGVIYQLLHLNLLYMVPMLVFLALGKHGIGPVYTIIATAFVMLIGNFIPVPGATGGIEYSFIQFFGSFVKEPVLSSGMLIWRFITYILGMLAGAIMLIIKKGENRKCE